MSKESSARRRRGYRIRGPCESPDRGIRATQSANPIPEPSERTRRGRGPEGNVTRHGELDLGASPRRGSTPSGARRSAPRARASREAPSVRRDRCAAPRDRFPCRRHGRAREAGCACDSTPDLDVRGTGMAESVDQRLPSDPVDVVSDRGVQGARRRPRRSLGTRSCPRSRARARMRENACSRSSSRCSRRAEPPHRVAALLDDPPHEVQHAVQARAARTTRPGSGPPPRGAASMRSGIPAGGCRGGPGRCACARPAVPRSAR